MSVVRKSISFTKQQDTYIKSLIKKGFYTNDSEYVRDIVRKQAFELAKEYDAKYPDWMDRESLSAQFRNSVRISLKKLTKERVSSVALSIHLGAFLLKRKETLAIEATA